MASDEGRIVAIDVRAQLIGYVVFDSSTRLLEWGMRATNVEHRVEWIGDLVRLYQPLFVVLRSIERGGRRDTPGARQILRMITAEARHHFVPAKFITNIARQRFFFESYGLRTKYEIAPFLAATFPELKAKLPPSKRVWKPVPRRMSVFDAAQVGIVFLATSAREDRSQNTGTLSPAP